jgi:hypothetical protein
MRWFRMSDKQILEQVMDECETVEPIPQPEEPFDEPWMYQSKFGWCLSKVKCKARVTGTTIHIRPVNCDAFLEFINANGLNGDRRSQFAVRWMRENPSEYLRFIH